MGRLWAGLASIVWILVLLVGVFGVVLNVPVVRGSGTIYIKADGSIDPPVAPISSVDNITYTLTANINDSVVIERENIVVNGAGHAVTGSGSGNGITLTDKSNVTLRNMTIKNFNNGIVLSSSSDNNVLSGNNVTGNIQAVSLDSSSDNNVLSDNNVTNNGRGIVLSSSSDNVLSGNNVAYDSDAISLSSSSDNNVLSDNSVTANYDGISVDSSSDNVLSGNNITASHFWGIVLSSSSDTTLSGNVMGGNQFNFGVSGSALSHYLNSVDASNLVDGKPVYYFVNQSDLVVNADTYPEVGYLGFVNCANVTAQGLDLTNNGQGLLLAFTNDSKITGNNVANNYHAGIVLDSSSDNTLAGNNVANSFAHGIWLSSSSDNVLSGNNITANIVDGIWLSSSSDNNVLSGNNVTANYYCGIVLDSCSDNVLSGNNVTHNEGSGIWLSSSSNNTLSGNVMGGNGYDFRVDGYTLSEFLQSVATSNVVNGKPVYYFVNQSDLVVNADTYPEVGYLGFVNCANVTAQGLDLTNNGQGLLLAFTNDSKITGNNVANNYEGIVLANSSGNVLSANNVTNHFEGIWLSSSSGNKLSGNSVTNNGVRLESIRDNTLSANSVEPNGGAIVLDNSSDNVLSGNNVADNYGTSIVLDSSSNNSIFHNTFVNGFGQVYTEGSSNIWDDGYPSGGNYWSLWSFYYKGQDSNDDGIGDTPCVIDANNTDRYPLMAPYNMFDAGRWNGTACSIGVMSNSLVSGFKVDVGQKTIAFNVTGAEGSAGFCRVTIPNIIVQNLWQDNYTLLVDGKPWPFSNWTDTTNTYLYVNYTNSQHQTVIIPELPSLLILPILMIVTLLAIIVSRRKWSRHQTGS